MWKTSSIENGDILKVEFTENFQLTKFQSKTFLSSYSDKHLNDVSVHCISSSVYIVVTLEERISVFREDTQELVWELEFNSKCDLINLSDDLNLLLVVENSGTLHFLHLPSTKIIGSKTCEKDGVPCTIQNAFICLDSQGCFSVYAFAEGNIFFEISKIDISALYKALEEENFTEFFNGINITKEVLNPDIIIKSVFETFCSVYPLGLEIEKDLEDTSVRDYYSIEDMMEGDFTSSGFMFDLETKYGEGKSKFYDFSEYGQMKKVASTRDSRYIICLDEKNILLIFSAFTQRFLKEWGDGDIEDFVLYYTLDSDNLSISDCKIGLLRKCGSAHMFEIRKFPSFEFYHKTQLFDYAALAQSKPNQDSYYVLEGIETANEKPTHLKIVSVGETEPESRLLSLLNRRKFKEAEKYAQMCSLNDEVIYKTKISCYLKDYSNNPDWKFSENFEGLWKDLEESLNRIKDVEFIKSCLPLLSSDIDIMQRFFSSVHSWLVNNNNEDAKDLIYEVNNAENKLITYRVLPHKSHHFDSIKDFLAKDMLQYMISELINGELLTALTVWQRHKDELLPSLSSENIKEILNAVPEYTPSNCLIPFLKEDFLPSVLCKLPDAVEIIADWIIARIHLLELTEKEFWPENGSNLASLFLETFEILQELSDEGAISYSTSVVLSFNHKRLISSDQVGNLNEIAKNLNLLKILKQEFSCMISLTIFQESKVDVIFAILDRIKLKYIGKAISDFVRPYALKKNLDLDLILESYIKGKSNFSWHFWDDSSWEEHLTLVLENIHNSSYWTTAALYLVSQAAVPWTDRVKHIVEQGLKSDHPSKLEFELKSKQVLLKEVLMRYEIRNFPMDQSIINFDSELIHLLIKRIFKENRPSAFEDAKMVVLSFSDTLNKEHYRTFLQFYLNQNKFDKFVSLFSSIPSHIGIYCSHTLLCYVALCLEDNFLVKNNIDLTNTLVSAGLYLIEFLKLKREPIEHNLLQALKSMKKLLKEFDIRASLSDIKENAIKVLEEFISSVFIEQEVAVVKSDQERVNSSSLNVFRIKRLGYILELDDANSIALLITNCLQRRKYEFVIKLCGDLVSSYPSSQNAKTLLEVVNHFLENFQNIKNFTFERVVFAVCHLSNLAVTCCNIDMLEDCLYAVRLSTYFALLNKITGQQLFLSQINTDIYHKWRFHPVYEDEGFNLDVSKVVDFIVKLIPLFHRKNSNLKQAVDIPLPVIFSSLFKPIITEMAEKAQMLAAVRTLYLFYHLHMDFVQNKESTQEVFMLISRDLNYVTFSTLQRMITTRKLDLDLSLGLLSVFSNEQINTLEKLRKWSINTDLRCILSLGEIGTECCRVLDNASKCTEYDKIYRRALLLLRHNIKTTELASVLRSADSNYDWEVVKEIFSSKIALSTIFECCSAFDLVADHVLIAYVNNLLLESEKICLINAEIPEQDLEAMLDQTKCAIEAITSQELLTKNLENLLKKISSYSYEVLKFIHEQLLDVSANFLTFNSGLFEKIFILLDVLNVYQRISPPQEIERESWNSLHPTDMKFPVIANKRLPFWMFFGDKMFKIINPELTVNTLGIWLKIANSLNISKDDLVMITVKNYVMSYLEKLPSKHLIVSQDRTFLLLICNMMDNISNDESLVACAMWVAGKMLPGDNKVYFHLRAMELAENWYKKCPKEEKPFSILKKATSLYQHSAVERFLYQNNLASDVALSCAHNPVKLTEYFMENCFLSVESSIAVCKVLSEISKIIKINLEEIFCKYFYKWLNITENVMDNLDETFALTGANDDTGLEDTNEKNILRIINLILGTDSIDYHICDIIMQNFKTMTSKQRSRFLFCAVAVHGFKYVADSAGFTVEDLQVLLPEVLYSSELICLKLVHSQKVISMGVLNLIQPILYKSNHPKAIKCCAKICLEYNIWHSEIWDVLLQKLMAMSMTHSLQGILQTAHGNLTHMWHFKSFISAWNCIISSSFNNDSTDLPKVIERVYKTVLRCPCINALDIESLWNELKYFVKNINGMDLEDYGPVSDAISFIKVLKSLQENYK